MLDPCSPDVFFSLVLLVQSSAHPLLSELSHKRAQSDGGVPDTLGEEDGGAVVVSRSNTSSEGGSQSLFVPFSSVRGEPKHSLAAGGLCDNRAELMKPTVWFSCS